MRWLRKIAVVVLLIISVCTSVSSYSVSPAKWNVYMRQDYEIAPHKITIKVTNDKNSSMSIKLSLRTDLKDHEGYEKLPKDDWAWIEFAETDFTVPAKTVYEVPVTINVENASENYNKSWYFYIFVDQYAGGDSSGTTQFQYDYNLLWFIETPPRYVPSEERQTTLELPWLYIGIIAIGAVGAVAVIAVKRHKPGRKHEEEDIFN